jgi:competence protein ComEA
LANQRLLAQWTLVMQHDLDINTADSLAWLALPGMRPREVQRILAARDAKGYFADTSQLRGPLRSQRRYAAIWPYIRLDTNTMAARRTQSQAVFQLWKQPRNLNALDSATIVGAGLLKPKSVRKLLNRRAQLREFINWTQVSSIQGLADWEVKRLQRNCYIAPAFTPLNPNRATVAELESLPGIGPALAARIIQSRQTEGPFMSAEDLLRVKGIGPKLLDKMRPHIRVE